MGFPGTIWNYNTLLESVYTWGGLQCEVESPHCEQAAWLLVYGRLQLADAAWT